MKQQFEGEGEPFLKHALRLVLFYLRNIKEIGVTALRDALTLAAIIYNMRVHFAGGGRRGGEAAARKKARGGGVEAEVSEHL